MSSIRPVSLFNLKPFKVPKASLYLGGALVLISLVGTLLVGFDHTGFFANRNVQIFSEATMGVGVAFFSAPFLARVVKVAGVSALCWGCKKGIERGISGLNNFVQKRKDFKQSKGVKPVERSEASRVSHSIRQYVMRKVLSVLEASRSLPQPLMKWKDAAFNLDHELDCLQKSQGSSEKEIKLVLETAREGLGEIFSIENPKDPLVQKELLETIKHMDHICHRALELLESRVVPRYQREIVIKNTVKPIENEFRDLAPWLQAWQDVAEQLQSHLKEMIKNTPIDLSALSLLGKEVESHLHMLGAEFDSLDPQDRVDQHTSLMSVVEAFSSIYDRVALLEFENSRIPASPAISNPESEVDFSEGSVGYISDSDVESIEEGEVVKKSTIYTPSYWDQVKNSAATISFLASGAINSVRPKNFFS